jgi:hypothetical protein
MDITVKKTLHVQLLLFYTILISVPIAFFPLIRLILSWHFVLGFRFKKNIESLLEEMRGCHAAAAARARSRPRAFTPAPTATRRLQIPIAQTAPHCHLTAIVWVPL